MTILEKIKFEEDWLSEVNLTKENVKIAFAGIRATALEEEEHHKEDLINARDNGYNCGYTDAMIDIAESEANNAE